MKQVTFDNFSKEMEAFEKKVKYFDMITDESKKSVYIFDSPVWNTYIDIQNQLGNLIAKHYNLDEDLLWWYIYDNNWGERNLSIIIDGNEYYVSDINILWKVAHLND